MEPQRKRGIFRQVNRNLPSRLQRELGGEGRETLMTRTIDQEKFTSQLFDILDEVFVTHHGIFLDANTSLFETLSAISAAQASVPVGNKCASLAAQVKHVTFYIGILEKYIVGSPPGKVDWGEIWRTVEKVTAEQWDAYRAELKEAYERVLAMLRALPTWNNEDTIGGAMAIMVHTAYHLGEIRQALCTLTE